MPLLKLAAEADRGGMPAPVAVARYAQEIVPAVREAVSKAS